MFPTTFPLPEAPVSPLPASELTAEDLTNLLRHEPTGGAPGPSRLRVEHPKVFLRLPLQAQFEEFAAALTQFTNLLLGGLFSESIRAALFAGQVLPLNKKDGGIRPVVLGELLRRLAHKALLRSLGEELASLGPSVQLGLNNDTYGPTAAVLAAQSWACSLEGKVLVKLDIKKAFNSLSREAAIRAANELLPSAAPYLRWFLSAASPVWYHDLLLQTPRD